MAPVVPLFVVVPDSTNTAKPAMKEMARTAPRRWANESFSNIRVLLSMTAPLRRQGYTAAASRVDVGSKWLERGAEEA
jgi:hypothetical protein